MREQETIDYQDMIDLGGERDQMNDQKYVEQYGHNYFWVEIPLTKKKFVAFWCCETRKVELRQYGGEGMGDILSRFPVKDLEELKMLINLFKGITPEDGRKPMAEFNPLNYA